MLKFNNNHIFTGYLKQLLSSVNLPTYRIYTKEYKNYFKEHGVESPEIIETIPESSITYKNHIRYIPYIKDGNIMEYIFTEDASSTNAENASGTSAWKVVDNYYEDKKALNYVRHLRITNNIYDTYTHEYLGDYLRFLRDYYQLDLLPLYNCFSNKLCPNLYIDCSHNTGEGTYNSHFIFNTLDTKYKIYMIPVKFFKEYTIAIDCNTTVEMCCGVYGKYQDTSVDSYNSLPHATYKQYPHLRFNQPIVYSPLKEIYSFLDKNSLVELAVREGDLKLFIKLPANNTSSITILEGNYADYNKRFTYHKITTINDKTTDTLVECKNQTVMNMFDEDTQDIISLEKYLETREFKPITYLQLLAYNTGTSYPFADRLMEYLSDNVITHLDTIPDNIIRAQEVVAAATNNKITSFEGIWDERMQPIFYQFMQNYNGKIGTTQERNHDILGYVDKDVEQLFAAYTKEKLNNKEEYVRTSSTIANVDIYPDIYLATKDE